MISISSTTTGTVVLTMTTTSAVPAFVVMATVLGGGEGGGGNKPKATGSKRIEMTTPKSVSPELNAAKNASKMSRTSL
eukprot:scaffold157362_cov28-Tisochrysis_lutea.AAC.4